MKKVLTYIFIAVAAFTVFSCTQEKIVEDNYEEAVLESTPRVFFKTIPAATVKLAKEDPSLSITLSRGDYSQALDVPFTVEGEATAWFAIPEIVSFAAGEADADITITAKDVENTEMNVYYPLTISFDKEVYGSQYGSNAITFEIGITLPWIRFSDGVLIEGWWGEEEEGKEMYYQQISSTMRYCKIDDCWGYETMKAGDDYDVQPYVWYWDTETNYCYVPEQYMGYSDSGKMMYISDEPSFYNIYWNSQEAGKNGSGQVAGTDAWFKFHDQLREKWVEEYGDPMPYYDGEGKFYLADFAFWIDGDGVPTGKGYQFGGTQDIFVCSFAKDYSIEIAFEGIFTNKDGIDHAMVNVDITGADVTDVAIVLVEGKDPNDGIDLIDPEEGEQDESVVTVSAAGEVKLPFAEDAEDGFYTIVAVPVDVNGAYAWDFAVYETFIYGKPNPLYLEYTSDDFVAGVSKEDLIGTEWLAYAAGYNESATDRVPCAYVTFADAEDVDEDVDLVTCSGLAYTTAFKDSFDMEWYNGVLYTLGAAQTGTLSSYDVYAMTYSEESLGTSDYTMAGAYVADGIIALTNNSQSDNYYGIGFWAVANDEVAGYLVAREYLLLVNPAILEDASGAPAKRNISTLNPKNLVEVNSFCTKREISFNQRDWSKDVIASGKVWSYSASIDRTSLNFVAR